MKYSVAAARIEDFEADSVVYPVAQSDRVTDPILKRLDRATAGAVSTLFESGEFTGRSEQVAVLYRPDGFACGRVVLAGLGKREAVTPDTFRRMMGTVSRHRALTRSTRAAVYLGRWTSPDRVQAAAEGELLGGYRLREYKTSDSEDSVAGPDEMVFLVDSSRLRAAVEKAVERGRVYAEGQLLSRRLTAMPANKLTPKAYAAELQKLARRYGFSCRVMDEAQIRKEKMGALLAVAQGSKEPPRFVVLEYKGRGGRRPVVLVGKGVTFDSGGISLKQPLNMHEMKQDMGGSAAVVGAVVSAARLKMPVHVVGLLPLTENLPSGQAYRPGDIITSRKGLTIEIISTDAEGRLILADALDYANTFKPAAVVDIATLTGGALYILGYEGAPVCGTSDKLLARVEKAAAATGERVWALPLWDEFTEAMRSDIADLKNSGGRPAATLTAAAFLKEFIGEYPWVHIDMAYVDVEPKGRPYIPRGATGFGARLLTELLAQWKNL